MFTFDVRGHLADSVLTGERAQRYLYCNFAALIRKQCRARSLQRDYNDERPKLENGQLVRRFPEMPSGDAQRTWFPEMVVRLQSKWHQGVSMPTLISLRDELDTSAADSDRP